MKVHLGVDAGLRAASGALRHSWFETSEPWYSAFALSA